MRVVLQIEWVLEGLECEVFKQRYSLFCGQVREEIEFDNLAKQYLREMIKRECWDDMQVKGRALQVRNTFVSRNASRLSK